MLVYLKQAHSESRVQDICQSRSKTSIKRRLSCATALAYFKRESRLKEREEWMDIKCKLREQLVPAPNGAGIKGKDQSLCYPTEWFRV